MLSCPQESQHAQLQAEVDDRDAVALGVVRPTGVMNVERVAISLDSAGAEIGI